MSDLSNSLIGLSVLTGSDSFATFSASLPAVQSRAARTAQAAFTTAVTTPPWKEAASTVPESTQISTIRQMKTIIDKASSGTAALPDDVQTTFTAYKALDRLRVLADRAAKATAGSSERATLQTTFAKGLADLQTYLGTAPSTLVDLSFGRTARQAQTVGVAGPSSLTVATIDGGGVLGTRTEPLTALTGKEIFRIDLSTSAAADSVTVDLSTAPQPPTLDGVADAMNAAIAAVVRKDASGQPVLDDSGNPVPRWAVKVVPAKTSDLWGLSIERAGFETVAIDQVGAGDALMIANSFSTDATTTGATTTPAGPATTQITRFDDPAETMTRRTFDTITATDRVATERSQLAADADTTGKLKAVTVAASTNANGIATDAQGFSYVVGSSAGDMGANLSGGSSDMVLTKLDSEGKTVWRRNLGAGGSADGAAVAIAPDGGIVVAGTVTGNFEGADSDGDMLLAKYDAQGNEIFSSLERAIGSQTASAVAVGADGTIYVGGQQDSGGGDAIVSRFDATGRLQEKRVIDSGGVDGVKALAIAGDGALLALTGEGGHATLRRMDAGALSTDLATLDLGRADARALAVSATGAIAVVGSTDGPLAGTQVNATAGGGDGFVARIDAGLGGAAITYFATPGEDQADSAAFLGGALYVGGRTGGPLAGARTGTTDVFVARIDTDTGVIADQRQFGTVGVTAQPVRLAAIAGGNSVLGALGLHRGTLTPTDSTTLEAQTSLRPGDEFSIRVNGGSLRKITITADDTLTTLSDRVRQIVGTSVANITSPFTPTGRSLRLDVKPGNEIEFVAGGSGKDALAKLGLDARRISAPAAVSGNAPAVRPGGTFALDLTGALSIATQSDATIALARVTQAISYAQSAYRSLYWDDTKALLVDTPASNGKKAGSTAIEQAQLANYQAALTRLSSTDSSSYGF